MERGWNVWVWLLGVVLRRYIDFLILLIPTPLVSVLFCSSIYIRTVEPPNKGQIGAWTLVHYSEVVLYGEVLAFNSVLYR